MLAPRLQWIVPTQDNEASLFGRLRGTIPAHPGSLEAGLIAGVEEHMNGIIYIIGLIVVIMAILSFLGLR
jgi:hypothetical protein